MDQLRSPLKMKISLLLAITICTEVMLGTVPDNVSESCLIFVRDYFY